MTFFDTHTHFSVTNDFPVSSYLLLGLSGDLFPLAAGTKIIMEVRSNHVGVTNICGSVQITSGSPIIWRSVQITSGSPIICGYCAVALECGYVGAPTSCIHPRPIPVNITG